MGWSKLEVATMRNPSLNRLHNYALVVASIMALLTFAAGASAQQQDRPAQNDSSQSVPDAPQPQKKPASKPQSSAGASSSDSSSQPTQTADEPTPTQPSAKDENAFPEAVSRQAAKAAADAGSSGDSSPAPASTKHPAAEDNPFPESVSRDAAKAAGNEQAPPAAAKTDLPPGVSSSQSGGSFDDTDKEPGAPNQVTDPARAKKDSEVGGFYLKTGDYQGALLRYRDATAADPTNVEAIFGLAETQRLLRKNADAARNYQLYLDIVPNGPRAKQALKALKTLEPGK
jgi:tetratricopeptide (TPR) repeat protein